MSLYWYTPTPKTGTDSITQNIPPTSTKMAKVFTVEPSELKNLRNKVVVITGGSSGIGLATAKLLTNLDPSNKVSIIDRAPPPPSYHSASNTHQILFQKCEITDWVSLRSAFANTAKHYGRIDAVYVNAGIAEYGDQFFDETLDETGQLKEPDRRVLKIDMDAASDTVRLAIHHLRKNKEGGSIVITASLAGYLASAGAGLYSAAKHG
jgi:NAD(P)-dependent dehydrogenase (short-subunit alcohol dehydrogenase family)